jgi:hypothetical protein
MTLQLKLNPELRHLKRLYELSLKTAGQKPQLEEPTDEQKEWMIRRMKDPESSWRSFV